MKKHYKNLLNISFISLLILMPIILLFPLIHTGTLSYKLDTWFHLMRIYEMRQSILSGSLLGTLGNIYTFGGAGQIINGMYPSLVLRVLVAITSWLSPIMQVYAIILLILIVSSLSNYFVFKSLKFKEIDAFLASIVMTYSLEVFVLLQDGSFGLGIALSIVPWLFWGLLNIRGNNLRQRRNASVTIGIIIGLFFLSHIISAFFGILMVICTAILDLINKKYNFIEYIISGITSIIIGLPTLIITLVFGKESLSVSSFGRSPKSIFETFLPLFKANSGTAYFGWTAFTCLAAFYVLVTFLKHKEWSSLKTIALITILFGTDLGYVKLFDFMQFPERFWIFGMLLCVFILILEQFPGNNTLKWIICLLAFIPALNTATNYYRNLSEQPLWQETDLEYHRYTSKLNNKSYDYEKFYSFRTYVDYLPKEQEKYKLPDPKGMWSSKEMNDANYAHSVRKSNFKIDEIKTNKKQKVIPFNPIKNQQAHKNTMSMTIHINNNGTYDLPFWFYKSIPYNVQVNNSEVKAKASSQGRLSLFLRKGTSHVKITQSMPFYLVITYAISGLAIIGTLLYLFLRKRRKVHMSYEP
ncbi:hypothetical protein [Lactiplantibacillus modestisalitolerans]|uniref:YfhO family protein n=1 Tax=Lactiplantibacillus modestisalitolerans TaxID=1457219 RepID=A0ABV5WT53_9LACO|nr:hypothetical protein [Lactiplantibacillus modestisalitolerans]